MKRILGYIAILLINTYPIFSQSLTIKGQLNSWMAVNPAKQFESQFGLRYIPTINAATSGEKLKLDAEFSVNSSGFVDFHKTVEADANIKFYRAWMRLSGNQFEIRIGLQKINFGSASLLRPLMWFDQIDPRDPLQLTDGVYGALTRYYFLNNANIWFWVLYGNKNLKGWEQINSDEKSPELGGRIQIPTARGELGFSYHHRQLDPKSTTVPIAQFTNKNEDKFGIDGKWDMEIGFWIEGVLKHQHVIQPWFAWQQYINTGIDYTFGLGNGLNLLTECLWAGAADKPFETKQGTWLSAMHLNYPVSLFDNIGAIVYYDWMNHDWYRFIQWQRTYDSISFYLMVFWNPDSFNIYQQNQETNLFGGTGGQIMFVFNH